MMRNVDIGRVEEEMVGLGSCNRLEVILNVDMGILKEIKHKLQEDGSE